MKTQNENFYDLLKVARSANIAEIVAAYHVARNAFSKDSVATYSLFSAQEVQIELARLEQAYLTLSNIDKKRDYDRRLSLRSPNNVKIESFPNAVVPEPQPPKKLEQQVDTLPNITTHEISGTYLNQLRAQKGLSLDDVSRITKIPTKFLRAIEQEDVKNLPARVYTQGFVKNIASLFKLDPRTTALAYLEAIDSKTKEMCKE